MADIRGCNLPEDLYYLIEKHVWAKPTEGGLLRVGMTAVAGKLSGGKLAAVTVKTKALGQEVAQGKSVATIESSKFVGPVPAPVTGVLVRGNDKLASDPNLAVSDPYGEGWIAEIKPSNWDGEKGGLVTGAAGLAAYQKKLEADNISCA
ncbi:glycine cleavage system protein H [bacterium]|nr:MAG: glycine cleavage system protein H [bacterium]